MTFKEKYFNSFTIFVIVISVLIFVMDNINGKFFLNDFKVYYYAAKSLISGDKVYGVAFGLSSGIYKYSPLILLLFIPFSIIPYYISSVIFFILIIFSIIILFERIRFFLNNFVYEKMPKQENIIYFLAFAIVLNHVYRELHMGNTNIILLVILISCLTGILKSKYIYSGILFGIAILFKPFFLILILPIILFKKWKVLLNAGVFLLLFFLLFLLFFGYNTTILLHYDWKTAVLDHSSSYPSENTLDSILRFYTNVDFPAITQYIIIVIVAILYIAFTLASLKNSKGKIPEEKSIALNLIFGWMVLLAILPNIVNTDTEHFMYSLPLIVFIIYYLVINTDWLLRFVFLILFIMYSLNSRDIVGKFLSDKMTHYGVLGISNIIIIILSVYIFFRGELMGLRQHRHKH